ncbi:hypothetical protein [Enterococcus durans]|uniref:hypothetical protein n=1 Tax=Enterococcus durans TaxID=53345 RepID=UPI002432DAF5|nr:hypothetical protein [Enterococcus durans]
MGKNVKIIISILVLSVALTGVVSEAFGYFVYETTFPLGFYRSKEEPQRITTSTIEESETIATTDSEQLNDNKQIETESTNATVEQSSMSDESGDVQIETNHTTVE